ncbi:Troponin I [Portunus trituberculatus]|uniref:Troponin I n=1 Tax=Portunus trituberculatus TaxID=210409 RepID=A0A5B7DRQ5_PORTR|nr:Troponin I [Portunus trituberculatus]
MFLPRAREGLPCRTLTRHSVVDKLREICKAYHERLFLCESQKWDLEYEVRRRDYEVQWPKPRLGALVVLCDNSVLHSPGPPARPPLAPPAGTPRHTAQ